MSLLMEALRKAEEAKRKGLEQQSKSPETEPASGRESAGEPAPEARPSFTLEPREIPTLTAEAPPSPPREPTPVPESFDPEPEPEVLAQDALNEYLNTEPVQDERPPPRRRGMRQTSDQLAAASVFAAKNTNTGKPTYVKALLGIFFVLVSAGGGALWYLQKHPGTSITNPSIANYNLSSRGQLSDQQSPAVPDAGNNGTGAPQPNEELLAEELRNLEEQQQVETPEIAGTEESPDQIATPDIPADNLAPAAVNALIATTPATTDASTANNVSNELQITRSTSKPVVDNTLQEAFNTLQAGDLQTAASLYEQVLAETPNSRDAMLGLASIATRNGQNTRARDLYARLLQLNPRDPYARTGLLQSVSNVESTGLENELKALLSEYPTQAPLHFALGNFYAAGRRWSEAQAAYFNAMLHASRDTSGPVSPDYAFNLAVSLEQLQQGAAALNYYRQAQTLSLNSPPGFDTGLLRSRLAYLEQIQP